MDRLKDGLEESFRWYGPADTVSLRDIRQTGAKSVMSSLHDIAYGDVWPRDAIRAHNEAICAAGLRWSAVESVPVSEDIKTRTGNFQQHLRNYQQTLRNLGAEGITVVIYNFMPVLDWVRTDLAFTREDGSSCLYFDPVHFAAFEVYSLQREGAEEAYTAEQLSRAEGFFNSMSPAEQASFEAGIIDVFPGCKLGLSLNDVRSMLAKYKDVSRIQLQEHYRLFLEAVVPVAAEAGVRLAVHPDDPPYSILGLPRIVSCESDIASILSMVDNPANGLCFCTGSYGVRSDNDLPGMIARYGDRINAVHLRSVQRLEGGRFFEADHLTGSVDMYAVVRQLLKEQKARRDAGRLDWRLVFRPDHGATMLDDQAKPPPANPGYSCIGRMRGLAEIRGLQLGILRSCFSNK